MSPHHPLARALGLALAGALIGCGDPPADTEATTQNVDWACEGIDQTLAGRLVIVDDVWVLQHWTDDASLAECGVDWYGACRNSTPSCLGGAKIDVALPTEQRSIGIYTTNDEARFSFGHCGYAGDEAGCASQDTGTGPGYPADAQIVVEAIGEDWVRGCVLGLPSEEAGISEFRFDLTACP